MKLTGITELKDLFVCFNIPPNYQRSLNLYFPVITTILKTEISLENPSLEN